MFLEITEEQSTSSGILFLKLCWHSASLWFGKSCRASAAAAATTFAAVAAVIVDTNYAQNSCMNLYRGGSLVRVVSLLSQRTLEQALPWLCGPTGTAVSYTRHELCAWKYLFLLPNLVSERERYITVKRGHRLLVYYSCTSRCCPEKVVLFHCFASSSTAASASLRFA